MSKRVLKLKASVHTVVRELACTLAVDSPFVCAVEFAITDADNVYVGLPLCPHGDLERWLLAQARGGRARVCGARACARCASARGFAGLF